MRVCATLYATPATRYDLQVCYQSLSLAVLVPVLFVLLSATGVTVADRHGHGHC